MMARFISYILIESSYEPIYKIYLAKLTHLYLAAREIFDKGIQCLNSKHEVQ